MQETAGKPELSIIVTTYSLNRFNDVTGLLDSIHAQMRRDIETIIITERLPELTDKLEQYIADKGYPGVAVTFNNGEWGVSIARNLGVSHARGEIIAFVDDDAVLFPDWVEETVRTYNDSRVMGVTGPILPLWEDESMDWFPREFYWIFSCTHQDINKITEVRNGYCTNLSFRREAFETSGGFRPGLGIKGRGQEGWQEPGAEELDFAIRVKRLTRKSIVFNPLVKVKHHVYRYRFSMDFITKRAYWEGYAKAMVKHYYRDQKDGDVLSVEYDLLRRILFHLLPGIFLRFFRRPVAALRQLSVTIVILSCVAAGYMKSDTLIVFGRNKRYAAFEQAN